jgi:hypothetical protein
MLQSLMEVSYSISSYLCLSVMYRSVSAGSHSCEGSHVYSLSYFEMLNIPDACVHTTSVYGVAKEPVTDRDRPPSARVHVTCTFTVAPMGADARQPEIVATPATATARRFPSTAAALRDSTSPSRLVAPVALSTHVALLSVSKGWPVELSNRTEMGGSVLVTSPVLRYPHVGGRCAHSRPSSCSRTLNEVAPSGWPRKEHVSGRSMSMGWPRTTPVGCSVMPLTVMEAVATSSAPIAPPENCTASMPLGPVSVARSEHSTSEDARLRSFSGPQDAVVTL